MRLKLTVSKAFVKKSALNPKIKEIIEGFNIKNKDDCRYAHKLLQFLQEIYKILPENELGEAITKKVKHLLEKRIIDLNKKINAFEKANDNKADNASLLLQAAEYKSQVDKFVAEYKANDEKFSVTKAALQRLVKTSVSPLSNGFNSTAALAEFELLMANLKAQLAKSIQQQEICRAGLKKFSDLLEAKIAKLDAEILEKSKAKAKSKKNKAAEIKSLVKEKGDHEKSLKEIPILFAQLAEVNAKAKVLHNHPVKVLKDFASIQSFLQKIIDELESCRAGFNSCGEKLKRLLFTNNRQVFLREKSGLVQFLIKAFKEFQLNAINNKKPNDELFDGFRALLFDAINSNATVEKKYNTGVLAGMCEDKVHTILLEAEEQLEAKFYPRPEVAG